MDGIKASGMSLILGAKENADKMPMIVSRLQHAYTELRENCMGTRKECRSKMEESRVFRYLQEHNSTRPTKWDLQKALEYVLKILEVPKKVARSKADICLWFDEHWDEVAPLLKDYEPPDRNVPSIFRDEEITSGDFRR